MDVLGWVALIGAAVAIVAGGDLLLKRLSRGSTTRVPRESPDVQAHQQAVRDQVGGGGLGPQG